MLIYGQAETKEQIQEVYDHNMSAFFDAEEFDWSMKWLNQQVKDGWDIYSVYFDQEIIAAIFYKKKGNVAWFKQTPIKMSHQGNGFSHLIREYVEELAIEHKVKKLHSIIAIDNFRMVALNESHGYKKVGNFENSRTLMEWKKNLK